MFVLNIVIYGQIWNKCVSNHDHNPTVVQLVHQGPNDPEILWIDHIKTKCKPGLAKQIDRCQQKPHRLSGDLEKYYFLDATNHPERWILLPR